MALSTAENWVDHYGRELTLEELKEVFQALGVWAVDLGFEAGFEEGHRLGITIGQSMGCTEITMQNSQESIDG